MTFRWNGPLDAGSANGNVHQQTCSRGAGLQQTRAKEHEPQLAATFSVARAAAYHCRPRVGRRMTTSAVASKRALVMRYDSPMSAITASWESSGSTAIMARGDPRGGADGSEAGPVEQGPVGCDRAELGDFGAGGGLDAKAACRNNRGSQ